MIITLIWAFPEEFDNFMSALLLQKDIDKAKVIEAFVTEETNYHHCIVQSAISNKPKLPPSLSLPPGATSAKHLPTICSAKKQNWSVLHKAKSNSAS